ncbi:hypothetical protein [Streptomyces sp. XD-27]|uniref:hypothetical protein n=1 Tax=Streptomyces sp. XD-27 TaxID=3062779 RepID=UPI0026F4700B|nr:hypothetical protein [Streptomyces sp. XD-27]WKX72599.1 hypothetical protein Q3Y56_24255 [Streptomyces sp. XD-27]
MLKPRLRLRPGYWCECWTLSPSTGRRPVLLASIEHDSPGQATRWVRVTIRTIASALDRGPAHEAWDWVRHGYKDAEDALTNGEAATFAVNQEDTRLEWILRPVTFLPLAHREAVVLPECAYQFACPTTHKMGRNQPHDG